MAPFQLMSLPVELINKIVFHVPRRSDLATLRLASQTLNTISTPYYFATVPIYPDWDKETMPKPPFPNAIEYSVLYFENILDSDKLKRLVRKVEIYMCNPDCDHHPHSCLQQGWMPKPEMSHDWQTVYSRLPELPKLERVSLIFDRHGGGDGGEDGMHEDDKILHDCGVRSTELSGLLELLEKRIKDLSVRHLQLDYRTCQDDGNNSGVSRASILEGLQTLRLNVVHEQPQGEIGSVYKQTDCHEEWNKFPSTWLESAANLRHLTLYSDLPTGWFPKVDFRNVHFAHLETLALGQFVFSDDRHFEWIAAHAETLQELYLDHCSILYQGGASLPRDFWLDDEGYPTMDPDEAAWGTSSMPSPSGHHYLTLESYAIRWYDAFALFSRSLTHLRVFRFGSSSQWNFKTLNRRDDFVAGHPIMPWEGERDLKNELFRERYLVYDDWCEKYDTHWKDSEDDSTWEPILDQDVWSKEELSRFEEYPQCTENDERALAELLGKLGITWHGGE